MKFDLNTFKKISDEGDRFAYALETLKLLGEGGSRTVFLLSSRYALKVAQSDRGHSQNATEAAISADASFGQILARVHQHAPDFSWVISDLVRPLTSEDEFEKLFGMEFREFVSVIEGSDYHKWVGNPKWGVKSKSVYPGKGDETIGTFGIIDTIRKLIKSKKLHTPELQFIDHWGKTADGRVVILDYGVDDGNWKNQTIHAVGEGQQRGSNSGHSYLHFSPASESESTLEASNLHGDDELVIVIREFVNEVIRKCGDSWCLFTKKKKAGKHRKLGTHKTKKDAIDQEIAIQYSKHGR